MGGQAPGDGPRRLLFELAFVPQPRAAGVDGERDPGLVGEVQLPGKVGELGAELAETRGLELAQAHEHAADRAGAQVHPPGVFEPAAEGDAAAPRDPRGANSQLAKFLLRHGLEAGMDHGEEVVAPPSTWSLTRRARAFSFNTGPVIT